MKKKIVTICLIAVISVTAVIGGTMAYFTDSKTANNTFTVGNVKIQLDEAKVIQTGEKWTVESGADRVTANTYQNVYPGAVLPKDPMVTNIGNNNAYVRVQVTIDNYSAWQEIADGGNADSIFGTLGKGWTKTNTAQDTAKDTVTYTYTYSDVVAPGAETTKVFENVMIPSGATSEEMEGLGGSFTVNVVAEAIQSAGFDNAGQAFASFNN